METTSLVQEVTRGYEIILASSSPRRFEIVHDLIGLKDIKILKPKFKEDLDKAIYNEIPIQYVLDTSKEKAKGIIQEVKHDETSKLIICADTIVIGPDNRIYEKPNTTETQTNFLRTFCYKYKDPVRVVTAVTIVKWQGNVENCIHKTFYESTDLYFDNMIPSRLIDEYVATGDGLEVAGGFKIQGKSAIFIKRIDGDYYNVVGLPLNRTLNEIIAMLVL